MTSGVIIAAILGVSFRRRSRSPSRFTDPGFPRARVASATLSPRRHFIQTSEPAFAVFSDQLSPRIKSARQQRQVGFENMPTLYTIGDVEC